MKLYFACLASYNAGRLHGAWVDASSDVDEMQEAIATMLRASPCPNVFVDCPECEGSGEIENPNNTVTVCPNCREGRVPSAEEWAVHDYDDFPNMGEYPGLADVAAYVELIDDHSHIDEGDMKAIVDNFGTIDEAKSALDDQFVGIFDNFRDYADERADEVIGDTDGPLAQYFDYDAWARDEAQNMTVIDCPSGVAVFYA